MVQDRSSGAPFQALIHRPECGGRGDGYFELAATRGPLVPGRRVTELATLADLALGAAARTHTGADTLLPTVSLALEVGDGIPAGPVRVRAWAPPATPAGWVVSRGEILSGDVPVGGCLGTFRRGGRDGVRVPALPWEAEPGAPLTTEESFTTAERRELERIRGALPGPDPLLPVEWKSAAAGRAAGSVAVTPLLANRAGALHGGVLAGLVAEAGARADGRPEGFAISTQIQFLAAAHAGEVEVACELRRRGRATSFGTVSITQRDSPIATGAVVIGVHAQAGVNGQSPS